MNEGEIQIREREGGLNFLWELIKFVFFAAIIVIPFRLYIAQPFVVNGASMDPTFETGEYLIVDQLTYQFENPERGSVIIFKYPLDVEKYFIKRVIGLPGETVVIRGSTVTIKNTDNPKGFTLEEPYIEHIKNDYLSVTLGENEYFVMGDNRAGSSDSRIWGPVDESLIVGRPLVRLFPINHLNFLPGYFKIDPETAE